MRVAVIGGGLAGLAAAHALTASGASVTVLEAAGRFGGQVHTRREGGCVIEDGAEGFPARREAVRRLAGDLGLASRVIEQTAWRNLAFRNGRLEELPPGEAAGLLGMAVSPEDLGAGLASFRQGCGELIAALVEHLRGAASLLPDHAVRRLARNGAGWIVESGHRLAADAVVVAVPPRQAVTLLEPVVGAVPELASLPLVSSVTVTLAYPRAAAARLPEGTGVIVPGAGPHGPRAITFCSAKFAARAPDHTFLLRVFFRPADDALGRSDAAWAREAEAAVTRILRLDARPAGTWVSRWPSALPIFPAGHREAMASLRLRLATAGGLELAGSAVDGGGMDGAVRSALLAARRLLYPTA
jgi:oxygen-dependent protoporphyrinogen oxidase